LLALGRALLDSKVDQKEGCEKTRLHEALDLFRQAGSLFDWNKLPVLASSVERLQAILYARLVELGELGGLDDVVTAAMSSYRHLEAAGDARGRRAVMLIAAEALVKVK
jgi:hypothetical protein